jgi:hypothetical protein
MSMGPPQLLIVLGCNHSDFHDALVIELERLEDEQVVRVIDALALYKDIDGNVEMRQLNVGDSTSIAAGGAKALPDEPGWDLLAEIPTESAAALVLLQHHWALRLHDVIANIGRFRTSDGFIISPLDLN